MRRGRGRYGRDRWGGSGMWAPYVPVAERRAQAAREAARLAKKGHAVSPVVIEGRSIARTFWGKAWCDNLERYSDFANRLPRGRTYVRNGSVIDLQVAEGMVSALVSGSEIYRVSVAVSPVPLARWEALCRDCGGAVDSVVELLQGRLSRSVMERICRERTGLFPAPSEVRMTCSCPDSAVMCKHVAAVLYGIGARLDDRPELLFRLRGVDETELIAGAGEGLAATPAAPATGRVIEGGDLSAIFGVELETGGEPLPVKHLPASSRAPRAAVARDPEPRPPEARAQCDRRRMAAVARDPEPRPPAPVPQTASPVLSRGTAVRMLAGIHAGRTGVVTWVREEGRKVTYAVSFQTESGRATTQVSSSSRGTKWEVAATREGAATIAKGTAVRMLSGLYAGYTGVIAAVSRAGTSSGTVYALLLTGPRGKTARTTVKRTTLGRSWELV